MNKLTIALFLLAAASSALGQSRVETASTQPVAEPQPQERAWSFSISAYTYFVPNSHEYVQPTFTADHDWLHLETRYNYEDQNTASAWVGYNFSGGEKLAWEITPMIGGVFGDTTGFAPGYKLSLSWRNFELYSEGEVVIDTGDSSNSFFYTWTELTYSPLEWFRFGFIGQRTHAYESDREFQPGLLIGFIWQQFDISGYVLNPDDDPIFILGLRYDF